MSDFSVGDILYILSTWALPAVIAITMHEAAHGYVAWRLGDDTAFRRGRVSLNPLKHIDPFGTVFMPLLLLFSLGVVFGYAKPVPVRFDRLERPKQDMVWVAAAGPIANLMLAFVCAVLIHVGSTAPGIYGTWIVTNLYNGIWVNLLLAVFNMIPLPPLDGGRVAVGMLPMPLAARLARIERLGMFILLGALLLLPWLIQSVSGIYFNPFLWLVLGPVEWLHDLVVNVTGLSGIL